MVPRLRHGLASRDPDLSTLRGYAGVLATGVPRASRAQYLHVEDRITHTAGALKGSGFIARERPGESRRPLLPQAVAGYGATAGARIVETPDADASEEFGVNHVDSAAGQPKAGSADERPVVLHVLEAVGGGTARHVVDLVRNSPQIRHVVAAPSQRDAGWLTDHGALCELEQAGAEVVVVPMHRRPWHVGNARSIAKLYGVVGSRRVQVVHGHAAVGGALARFVGLASRRPVVVTPNGLLTSHSAILLERLMKGMTSVLVAVSPSEGQLALDLRITHPSRLEIVPNGIKLPAVDVDESASASSLLRSMAHIPSGVLIVGGILRLAPQKQPLMFVEVCRRVARELPDVHFVMIGGGPLEEEIDAAIGAGQFEGRFHRLVVERGASDLLPAFDVFLMPSAYEGGPYAPLEAMRAGVPVVLTDCVGSRDCVTDGESGFIRAIGDADGLTLAVCDLLRHPELRAAFALASRRRLHDYFDVRRMGAATVGIYDNLLNRCRSAV